MSNKTYMCKGDDGCGVTNPNLFPSSTRRSKCKDCIKKKRQNKAKEVKAILSRSKTEKLNSSTEIERLTKLNTELDERLTTLTANLDKQLSTLSDNDTIINNRVNDRKDEVEQLIGVLRRVTTLGVETSSKLDDMDLIEEHIVLHEDVSVIAKKKPIHSLPKSPVASPKVSPDNSFILANFSKKK